MMYANWLSAILRRLMLKSNLKGKRHCTTIETREQRSSTIGKVGERKGKFVEEGKYSSKERSKINQK